MTAILLLLLGLLLPLVTALAVSDGKTSVPKRSTSSNNTVSTADLKTWWHNSGENNTWTAVRNGNVRQSHLYSVQVSSSSDPKDTYYDSFAYETIPRNGNGNIINPNDGSSLSDQEDGITIEHDVGLTMAWSSFLYASDATVKVSRLDGNPTNASNVMLRPTGLGYHINDWQGDVYITVPFSSHGSRFSVEFLDDVYDFHDSCATATCAYTQTQNSDGFNYRPKYTDDNPVVGSEPLNALLIFASPMPSSDKIPDSSASTSLVMQPGLVSASDLYNTKAKTVIFPAGVYWLTGIAHANLSSTVNWVYFAPGSYVKGAIEFNTASPEIKATGHGVLSGEQYVYQANPSNNYCGDKSNDDSLRMWRGISVNDVQQTFILDGITVNAPPFNSMDFTGDMDTLSVEAHDYKQIGAFFGQTDGLEIYSGSTIHDVFYHSNDDTIKTYYSDVSVERIVVWKAHTAPIIQFGWYSRNLTNITVNDVDVIHSRWNSNGSHPSLIGANQVYQVSEDVTNTADVGNTIKDVVYSNIRAENIMGDLFRIVPLANIDGFTISNVSLASFPVWSDGVGGSQMVQTTDENGNAVTIKGFSVDNFSVNGSAMSVGNGAWNTQDLAKLNVVVAAAS